MIKELKYFLYISIIIIFFTLITKYYFSDKNKKYSHVNINFFKFKMKDNKLNLPLLLSDYESQLKKGDNLIFAAFGGGFNWGSIYLKWAYNS